MADMAQDPKATIHGDVSASNWKMTMLPDAEHYRRSRSMCGWAFK